MSSGRREFCVSSMAGRFAHLEVALQLLYTIGSSMVFQRGMGSEAQLELFLDTDCVRKATEPRSISGRVVIHACTCVSFLCLSCRNMFPLLCASGIRSDGHGYSVDDAYAVCLECSFRQRCWAYHGQGGSQGSIAFGERHCDDSQQQVRIFLSRFLREAVDNGKFDIAHVPSAEQYADFLAKRFSSQAFLLHRNL